jgi:hypothetical protein
MIATNASLGAIIRLRSTNTCSGLSTDGTNCAIDGIGTNQTMNIGSGKFGLDVDSYPVTAVTNATGAFNPNTNYNVTPPNYSMQSAVTSTYGDDVADTNSLPNYKKFGIYTFAAAAALTTPAGIYTNNYSMIATGTF